jgi:hypothetical protein
VAGVLGATLLKAGAAPVLVGLGVFLLAVVVVAGQLTVWAERRLRALKELEELVKEGRKVLADRYKLGAGSKSGP